MSLDYHRSALWRVLVAPDQFTWPQAKPLIEAWWKAYKQWERTDTFDAAYRENRMSVRTFGGNFFDMYRKSVGLVEDFNVPEDRFYKDSKYSQPLTGGDARSAKAKLDWMAKGEKTIEPAPGMSGVKVPGAYWANKSLDATPFLMPENFATRDSKYDWGLHDLSASLLNNSYSIFDQIHNDNPGAQFSFMPLARQEDQATIYNLIRLAKAKDVQWQEIHELVRGYRARMTRIKLAQNFDMGTGFSAIPLEKPTPGGRDFKVRYGLINDLTVPKDVDPSGKVKVTRVVYEARQQAAFDFRAILSRQGTNEIIIALRQHEGPFPITAQRSGRVLKCYVIDGGKQKYNGHTISEMGAYT